MLPTNSEPGRRFLKRLLFLSIFAIFSYFLHLVDEKYDGILLLIVETGVWLLWVLAELSSELGGVLKSRPDSKNISVSELFVEDQSALLYLVIYFLALAAFAVNKSLQDQEINITPGTLFVLVAPVAAFIIWRLYRLESRREAT